MLRKILVLVLFAVILVFAACNTQSDLFGENIEISEVEDRGGKDKPKGNDDSDEEESDDDSDEVESDDSNEEESGE